MKANGMRAWRRANKAMRRRIARENRLAGFSDRPGQSGRYARRHWRDVSGHNGILTQRPVVPCRVCPRDLVVGMTQGARKRAARVEAGTEYAGQMGMLKSSRRLRLLLWAVECNQRQALEYRRSRIKLWSGLRTLYRLGERLRPCPGCESCLGRECIGCEGGQLFEGDVCERCRRTATGERICDGSGVLPAKRHRRCGWWLQTRTAKNATLRCGMPTDGGWLDCQHCGGSGWLPARGE